MIILCSLDIIIGLTCTYEVDGEYEHATKNEEYLHFESTRSGHCEFINVIKTKRTQRAN